MLPSANLVQFVARIIEQFKVGKRIEVCWRLHNGTSVYDKGAIVGESRKYKFTGTTPTAASK
jgi:hypothetical protein